MVKLKVLQKINDTMLNRKLIVGEIIEISKERLQQMRTNLANDFLCYFQVIEIKKNKSKK